MRKFNAAIIGIGGFGKVHTNTIVQLVNKGYLQCVAFTEINIASNKEQYEKLTALGAQCYDDPQKMFGSHPEIDFVVIATPIALHKPMSIAALERGFHVLMEKPPAVTIQDVDAIIEAKRKSGKLCQVNFQNVCGEAFRLAVNKLREGVIGDLISVTGVGMWKRTEQYYERTTWAGKLTYRGEYILDGTINNPFSHLLNNCLIVAGLGNAAEAVPDWVQAELYKGHDIEGEDTSCIKIRTETGVEVRFYTTLCHRSNDNPYIVIEGTQGKMIWNYDNKLQIESRNRETEQYSFAEEDKIEKMYVNLLEAMEDGSAPLYSSIEASRNFVLSSNGAFESSRQTFKIADPYLIKEAEGDTTATYIRDIHDAIRAASEKGALFSEIPAAWSVKTPRYSMKGYNQFELAFESKQ